MLSPITAAADRSESTTLLVAKVSPPPRPPAEPAPAARPPARPVYAPTSAAAPAGPRLAATPLRHLHTTAVEAFKLALR